MIGPRQSDGPMVIVDDLDEAEISEEDRHHLAKVLRLRPGASIVLCDGAGAWRPTVFGDERDSAGEVERAERPTPNVAVAFALVKGERPELIVQKLTEIGVEVIVPFLASRSVVRWDPERAHRQHIRLVRVAREACHQSRRPFLPVVSPLLTLGDVAQCTAASLGGFEPGDVALADVSTGGVDAPIAGVTTDVRLIAVGPEGGWADEERALVGRRVDLGPFVLRAETAAIVAGARLVEHRRTR